MISCLQKTLAILAIASVLSACGGGGGGGGGDTIAPPPPPPPPPEPVQEFSMSAFKSTAPGILYSSQLSGSDSLGGQWTGAISVTNRSQTMVDGILATPQDVVFSIFVNGVANTSGETTYIDASGYALFQEPFPQDGTRCIPAFPYQLPDFIKVGDSAEQPTETCAGNEVIESSWKAEDAGNGNLNFTISTSSSDGSLALDTWILNSAGDLLAYKRTQTPFGDDNATLTLQSN